MQQPVTIRRATPADAADVATIQVHGHQWAYRGLLPQPASTGEWIAQRIAAWLPQLAPDHAHHTFLALQEARPIGFVTVGPAGDDALPARSGAVLALYLEPEVIGTGVGRALLARAVDELRARGCSVAVLWVLEQNARARRFYERDGWAPDGARKDEERDGKPRHEIRYRRAL